MQNAGGSFSYDQNDRLVGDGYDDNRNTTSVAGISNTYDFENHMLRAAKGQPDFASFRGDRIRAPQEFVLRWSRDGGSSFTDIMRQQWNFSPPGSMHEAEEFQVELSGVTVLELIVNPNISGGAARASLRNFRLS